MENLPKIVNLHVHLFALYPYYELFEHIRVIDPLLYAKIYCLKTAIGQSEILLKNIKSIVTPPTYLTMVSYLKEQILKQSFIDYEVLQQLGTLNKEQTASLKQWIKEFESSQLVKNTLAIFNPNIAGVSFNNNTSYNDWIPYSTAAINKNCFLVSPNSLHPFHSFENIQKMTRIIVRHYKIYYYLWMYSLEVNSKNGIYYLNVRSKPGSISTDVAFGTRLYLTAQIKLDYDLFVQKLTALSSTDTDIKLSDHKYMYNLYSRIKCESDIVSRAVISFNNKQSKLTNESILNQDFNYRPHTHYTTGVPQMCVQYIITFSKKPKNEPMDMKQYMLSIKMVLYIAVIINAEYKFPFFNGYDLVGNEQISHSLEEFTFLINKLFYFRKYDIHFYPHLGESNSVHSSVSSFQKYLIEKGINRIGHGITFAIPQMEEFLTSIHKVIYLECCPISNKILGYIPDIGRHPVRKMICSKTIRPVICSDDNGLFGYDTVQTDYGAIIKDWKLSQTELCLLIKNGIYLIPKPYRTYYLQVFQKLCC